MPRLPTPPSHHTESEPLRFARLMDKQADETSANLSDPFNPYADPQSFNGLDATPQSQQINQINPYTSDTSANTAVPFYQQQSHMAPVRMIRFSQA